MVVVDCDRLREIEGFTYARPFSKTHPSFSVFPPWFCVRLSKDWLQVHLVVRSVWNCAGIRNLRDGDDVRSQTNAKISACTVSMPPLQIVTHSQLAFVLSSFCTPHSADFYVQLASLALLYYDYLLTLPFEIKYIWTAPRKLSSFLYFCCRYALVANLIWMLAKVGEDEVGLGGIKFHERGLRVSSFSPYLHGYPDTTSRGNH